MIKMRNVSTSIKKKEILHDVNIDIGAGEFVALVGPNGAGKTTLLKHLNGLLKPTRGSVEIAGQDTRKAKTAELARRVGFLFQNPDQQILCQTVRAEIEFGLKHTGVPKAEWETRVASAAGLVGLEGKLDDDPLLLTRSRRQRVALASVLATNPEILVLDEPTSAQDEAETTRIMEIAKGLVELGATVILVSHDMELVERYASRAIVLVDGRIEADGTTAELFADEARLIRASLSMPGLFRLARAFNFDSTARELSIESLADFIEGKMTEESA
jgi:energy-coupling factor transport system ATP-binding protein